MMCQSITCACRVLPRDFGPEYCQIHSLCSEILYRLPDDDEAEKDCILDHRVFPEGLPAAARVPSDGFSRLRDVFQE